MSKHKYKSSNTWAILLVFISLQAYGLTIPRTMAAMIAIRISIPMHVHLRVFLCSLFAFTSWPTPEVTYSSAFPTCTIRSSFDYFYFFFCYNCFIFWKKYMDLLQCYTSFKNDELLPQTQCYRAFHLEHQPSLPCPRISKKKG